MYLVARNVHKAFVAHLAQDLANGFMAALDELRSTTSGQLASRQQIEKLVAGRAIIAASGLFSPPEKTVRDIRRAHCFTSPALSEPASGPDGGEQGSMNSEPAILPSEKYRIRSRPF